MKKWYGPNCLKKWDKDKWIETLPKEKRQVKHTKDLNLNGDSPNKNQTNINSG